MVSDIETFAVAHSSTVEEVQFNPDEQSMTVFFKSGGAYHHSGVSRGQAEALATDPSPGAFYAQTFRK